MPITGAIVVFVIAWWMVFFMVLPIGVRGQFEDGEVVDGTEPGAPVRTDLLKKGVWASIGATVVLVIAYLIMSMNLFNPATL